MVLHVVNWILRFVIRLSNFLLGEILLKSLMGNLLPVRVDFANSQKHTESRQSGVWKTLKFTVTRSMGFAISDIYLNH